MWINHFESMNIKSDKCKLYLKEILADFLLKKHYNCNYV
jgi:hypothetical protein